MKALQILIFLFGLLITSLCYAQLDKLKSTGITADKKGFAVYDSAATTLNTNFKESNRIDSLTDIIDSRKVIKIVSLDTNLVESVNGDHIISIKKKQIKNLNKYILSTNRKGNRMDIKCIELYLFNGNLIKSRVFFDEKKQDFYKTYYYKDNSFFLLMSSSWDMRISLDENGQEYLDIAKKLIKEK